MEETTELVKGFLYANDSVFRSVFLLCGMLVQYSMNLLSFQFFFLPWDWLLSHHCPLCHGAISFFVFGPFGWRWDNSLSLSCQPAWTTRTGFV
jgi:hypothetical protein